MAEKFKKGKFIKCKECQQDFYVQFCRIRIGKKFCSVKCAAKGRNYQNLFIKGHKDLVPKESRGHSEETRKKISQAGKGKNAGLKAWNWIQDRTLVKTNDRQHNDPVYKQWKKTIHIRDKGKCRIGNEDCDGRLEAHHISPWHSHPELRYEINNGILLCHAHHPRKRDDEVKLAPFFQYLVIATV